MCSLTIFCRVSRSVRESNEDRMHEAEIDETRHSDNHQIHKHSYRTIFWLTNVVCHSLTFLICQQQNLCLGSGTDGVMLPDMSWVRWLHMHLGLSHAYKADYAVTGVKFWIQTVNTVFWLHVNSEEAKLRFIKQSASGNF